MPFFQKLFVMRYEEFEKALSPARLNRYLLACSSNKNRALQLYRLNILLCKKMYGILNVLEVVLRNAINVHYQQYFADPNWIKSQLLAGGMLSIAPKKREAAEKINKLIKSGKYTSDRLVSCLSFGFWTYLFTKYPFLKGGQSILKILPNKSKPLGQRAVYNDLMKIKNFRNRIAHHEPICFDGNGQVNIAYAQSNYNLILKYLYFLGFGANQILWGLDASPNNVFQRIDDIANSC